MSDFQASLKFRFQMWRDAALPYGIIAVGAGIVVYGFVAQ